MTHEDTGGQDRLSGWKEIAAHLRRSVRTAQRWEAELGLPVQRVTTLKGQVIFASRAQLDDWLARNQGAIGEAQAPPTAPSPPPEPAPAESDDADVSESASGRRLVGWLGGLGSAALVIVVAIWAGSNSQRGVPVGQSLQAVGQAIEARGPGGDLIWSLPLDAEIRGTQQVQMSGIYTESAALIDLRGDGGRVHLMPVAFGETDSSTMRTDALLAIDDEGALLWQVSPEMEMVCGGQRVAGPWRIRDVAVSSSAEDRRVWIAYIHHTDWQSFVVEVTPDGSHRLRYVQAGWVGQVAEWETAGRTVLVAGGVLNEHRRASVALIDLEQTERVSMMPGEDPAFQCEVDDAIPPRSALLFPALDLTAAQPAPYTMVSHMSVLGRDLRVQIDGSNMIAMLAPNGTVQSLVLTDLYRVRHDAMTNAGRLDHFADACPVVDALREVRAWTPEEDWHLLQVGRDPG